MNGVSPVRADSGSARRRAATEGEAGWALPHAFFFSPYILEAPDPKERLESIVRLGAVRSFWAGIAFNCAKSADHRTFVTYR